MSRSAAVSSCKRLHVFVSKCRCIFANLAFEEWLFRNHDIRNDGEAVLLWSNSPTVVIGRHQNPWMEANLTFLEKNRISLVRRHSGGGAVYHDLGNLNISILTEQKQHNRPRNLTLIASGLNQYYNLNLMPNKRDDLLLGSEERKVSGTAARIAHGRAYHHLTLLVHVDTSLLKAALGSVWKENITTNASRSTPAKAVGYLNQDNSNITVEDLAEKIISIFKSQYSEYYVHSLTDIENDSRYPGVKENQLLLRSWEWNFGKSPKFSISTYHGTVSVESGFIVDCSFNTNLISTKVPYDLNKLYVTS
uniref:BPL/LPL catalytic domain-containing protein n=1 Tax=Syphacia muris TaxID=451379 RepID=A0A0N5ADH5_9BILA